MTTIVKVQRPICPPEAPWLVYDKSHKHVQQLPWTVISPAVVKAMGADMKGYFEGHWSSIVGWAIGKRVENQDW